jgi:cystathionine gamma-synthase
MKRTLIRPEGLPESLSTPVVTPLMPSVVYASTTPDELDSQYEGRASGYTYAREGHPNADVVARRINQMEGCEDGLVLGSGMAAVAAALLGLTQTGDHVLGGDQLYGRSLRLMREDLPRLGIETTLADPTNIEAFRAAVQPNTNPSSQPSIWLIRRATTSALGWPSRA